MFQEEPYLGKQDQLDLFHGMYVSQSFIVTATESRTKD